MAGTRELVSKNQLYSTAQVVWFLVVAGVIVLVFSGKAESYVSVEQFPEIASTSPELIMVGAGAVLILAGVAVVQVLKKRAWKRTGTRANLRAEGGGLLFGKPDLTGNVRGRQVRARTFARKESNGDQGSASVT